MKPPNCGCCARKDRSLWDAVVLLGFASALCSIAIVVLKIQQNRLRKPFLEFRDVNSTTAFNETSSKLPSQKLLMVYICNSMLSRQDCPSLVNNMINHAGGDVSTVQCLRSGATLTSLWKKNRGCFENQFNNHVDFVIMNDQSQSPARQSSRSASINTIKTSYAPLFNNNGGGSSRPPVPIIIQTPAYHEEGIQDSKDLGDFDQFTKALAEGVRQYRKEFNKLLSREARIAPVGEAFRSIRKKDEILYNKLYASDGYHLSPYGTWLQACIIYITCLREKPPSFVSSSNVPHAESAKLLQFACDVTGKC